jgi:DNA-binding MarR family transcriptional regulator
MGETKSSQDHTGKATAEKCARGILETVPAVMRMVRAEMRRGAGEAVSVPQFRVLAFLGRNNDASLSAVARFIGVADATASALVERLVRRGLVVREGDPEERRRVRLGLTPEGSKVLERAGARTRRHLAVRLASLKSTELSAVARGLDLLRLTLITPSEEEPGTWAPRRKPA